VASAVSASVWMWGVARVRTSAVEARMPPRLWRVLLSSTTRVLVQVLAEAACGRA
jgi:hypothetical protein